MKRCWRILAVLAVIVGIVVAGGMFLGRQPEVPSVIPIRLPDGSPVSLEAITYGTNHLVGPRLGHVATRLPQPLNIMLRRIFGKRAMIRFSAQTDSPKLVLWLNRGPMARPFAPGSGHCELRLADTNGTVAGPPVHYGPTYPLEVKEFSVFPRRDSYFMLNIYHHDATGAVNLCGSMPIKNPLHAWYPQWRPGKLPATRRAGDIEVTLENFSTRLNPVPHMEQTGTDARLLTFATNRWDATNISACVLQVRSLAGTNCDWWVADAELSDATGNTLLAPRVISDGRSYFALGSSLWPGEAAWKLKLNLVRDAGLATDEHITFRNVPLGVVGAQNWVGWTTNFNGVTLTLDKIVRKPSVLASGVAFGDIASQIIFRTSGLTNGLRLDFVTAITDNGVGLNGDWKISATERINSCWIPADAKTADFTFAVRRARQVEFLVKPEINPLRVGLEREH